MSQVMGVLIALAIGLFGIPTFIHYEQVGIDNARIAATAQQLKQVSDATQQYIQANATAIEGVATATAPATITVPMLQATGYLPASFSAANPYGQIWQAQALQPIPGQLQVVVLPQGGTAIPAAKMTQLASLAGQQGGFVPYASQYGAAGTCAIVGTPCMMGAFSGWQVSMANYADPGAGYAGSLLYFNNGALTNNYLYRNAVPGNPALNTMNTPLIMGATATAGTVCSPNGAIAQDGTGAPLDCVSGIWTSPGIPCTHGSISYSVPGSYTFSIPFGCTKLFVSGCGGGGGGSAGSDSYNGENGPAGAGGGAGSCVNNASVSVVGGNYNAVVGNGGSGGYDLYCCYGSGNGFDGGSSYIQPAGGGGPLYTIPGGIGGGWELPYGGSFCSPVLMNGLAGANSLWTGAGGGAGGAHQGYEQSGQSGAPASSSDPGAGGGGGANSYFWCGINAWVFGGDGGVGAPGFLTLSW